MKTALPTIGIRPTIDGRRLGVRESLEDQTMNMAKAAAALIEANIRHASGEPVKCVIADTCIGGPAEAAACEKPDFCAISFIVTIVEPPPPQYAILRSISVNIFTT